MGPREIMLEGPGRPKAEASTALAFAPDATPRMEAARPATATSVRPFTAPVAAAPGRPAAPARVASADEPVGLPPVNAAAAPPPETSRSIYQRMMGVIGRVEEPALAPPQAMAPVPGPRGDAVRARAN
jgi:hypothetical protein